MASAVATMSSEDKIKDLCEDIDLQKFIYEDLQDREPGESEESQEILRTIRNLEAQVAALLGGDSGGPASTQSVELPQDTPPPAPVAATAPPRPTQERYRPSPGPVVMSGSRPRAPPPAEPLLPSMHTPHLPSSATSRLPGPDSVSNSYWPSSAPSPFVIQHPNIHPSQESSSRDSSRKRSRQDSGSSPHQHGPSKYRSRINPSPNPPRPQPSRTRQTLEEKLAENREAYEEMMEPGSVEMTAQLERISPSTVIANLRKEEADQARLIREEFQMEQDAELARTLQAQEDEYISLSSSVSPPRFHQPRPSFENIPDRTHFSKIKKDPGYPLIEPPRHYETILDEDDDDFEEISGDYFHSRFGGSSMGQPMGMPGAFPGMSHPGGLYMPPSLPPRNLPWLGVDPNAAERSIGFAQDVASNEFLYGNEDDEDSDDVVERYEERNFPVDIKNLLTGIKDIREATKADNEETPQSLQVTLMKHQKIGLKWMKAKEESPHKGGILADDMGLGKTIQAIALIASRPFTDPDRRPTLILAPKALLEQWKAEIGRHVKPGKDQLSVFIFHNLTRHVPWRELKSHDVVITTFGTLVANFKSILQAEKASEEGKDPSIVRQLREQSSLFGPSSKWHRIIVDEAQNIKNPRSKSSKACCRLDATYRWCLTGTPMMNRLEDLQALIKFLKIRPYNNPDKFKFTFTSPRSYRSQPEVIMAMLRVLVKAICLRRTKKTKIDGQPILQLPPKVVEKTHVVFSDQENEMYRELEKNTQGQIERYLDAGTMGKNYSHILVLLLRLRQACCHAHLLKGFRIGLDLPTAVPGIDLIANAKLLSQTVVDRLKNNAGEEDGTCPICMDSVENAVIYIPCGHSLCSECFARFSGPVADGPGDLEALIKCQNCRGPVDPRTITDGQSFKKVHDPDSLPPSEIDDEPEPEKQQEEPEPEESEPDTDEEGSNPKKLSLAELRAAAQKNKKEKNKYLRRLEKTYVPSSKIEKAMEILQANEDRGNDEKTIIFSQFTSLLDLLEVPIKRRGWGYARYDGSMATKDRLESVTVFSQDPACKIMLVSLKAGNAGLNLVSASHVIVFDPFWNPYIEDQAVDRAHRIGQTKDVFVHRLLVTNTVEDRIIELQDKKRDLIDGALDEGGSMNVARLDHRELAYLFGVRD
ncbi:hypothetical protein N7474_006386 [Penicillium riverlandense]|uniref:uncharacterized protein n=1 Tax=Penicillium riverlandense TaxID=1903569 RepID=UPI0025477AB7|nr:uncharacterized protein N7474_006386 [Penicillium riverlandense]KAJ5814609.1 hypothetical protein N7474_006386 [Penicillium riverlandense]